MVTISGYVRDHESNNPIAGVMPLLEKGNLDTFVAFGKGKAEAVASDTSGRFELSYQPADGTYEYVRLSFVGPDGKVWELASSNDPHIWDRTQPPSGPLDVLLKVPLPEPDRKLDDGGPETTPELLVGTVRDAQGLARSSVSVRLFTRSPHSERQLDSTSTSADGTFMFQGLAEPLTHSMRLEFGPLGEPVEVLSGKAEWQNDVPPTHFEYVLDLQPVAPPATAVVHIHGTVRSADGTPLPANDPPRPPIRLFVVSKKLGQPESVLATASPGPDGSYAVTVGVPEGRLNFVVTCQAEIPAGSGHWTDVARSRLVTGAPERVKVDLSVTDDRLRQRSEADTLSAVRGALDDAGLSDPEEVTETDEELLSEELSADKEQVQRHLVAMRLKKRIEQLDGAPLIPLEIYDALLAMSFPRKARSFAERAASASDVESALQESVRRQILPGSAIAAPKLDTYVQQLTGLMRLYDRTIGPEDSLATLLRFVATTAALTDTQIATLVDLWHQRTSPDQFWKDLHDKPPSGWSELTVEAVRRAIIILDLTHRHPETAQVFQNAHPQAPASWAAEMGLDAWKTLIAGLPAGAIPTWITGETLAERRQAWAEFIYRGAEERFPWSALRGDMIRDLDANPVLGSDDITETREFLKAQRKTVWHSSSPNEFHLGDSYIPTFEPQPSEGATEHLNALQRLFSLIPTHNAWTVLRALWLAGFRSARDISRIGQQRFLHRLEKAAPGAISRELALAIWRRARRRTQRALNLWRDHHPTHKSSQSQYTQVDEEFSEGEIKPEAAGEVAKLYAQALCGCEHCQSVLSPAAYFVDTLFWLQDRGVLAPLLSVRRDLQHLELDCENTETALPYIDLLIEILEQIVASAPIELLPHATERDTSALLAYPEHVDRPEASQAYQILKQSIWPRSLPYDLALDEVQTYLQSAGVSHTDWIANFNELADTPVSGPDLAVLELGGTPIGAATILAGGAPHPEELWGFDVPTTGFNHALHLLPELLERGQIDDFDFVLDLMRTRYLNADARLGVVLSLEAPEGADACDVANLALLRDRAPEDDEPIYVKPDEWLFTRMAVFLRLLDWIDWTPLTLDKALYALGVDGATPGTAQEDAAPDPGVQIASERLEGLQAISWLLSHTGLSAEELCSWWTGLDTYLDRQNRRGRPVVPLYDQRFLDPFVTSEAGSTAFALNATRTELAITDGTSIVDIEPVALAAALRVDVGELRAVASFLDTRGISLRTDIQSLWHLFRWTSLSRAARLTIEQVAQFIRISGLDPFADTPTGTPDPSITRRWFDALTQLRQHALSVGAVSWIFGHVGSEVARHAPTDARNQEVLVQLQESLRSLSAELASTEADELTLRAALTELGFDEPRVGAILQVVLWEEEVSTEDYHGRLSWLEPWVDDLDALKADLPEIGSQPDPDEFDARMSALLAHLQTATRIRLQRELVIGALEATYQGLTRAHLDLLDQVEFTGLTHFTSPIAALYLEAGDPAWSLEGASGVTTAEAGPAHEALHLVAKFARLVSALNLDVATLEEWLTSAEIVGAPRLTDLPATEDWTRLEGLWPSLGPALKWYDLDRRFRLPAPAANEIRAALRAGSARSALAMIAERQQWDLAPVGALAKAMGVASARLTVPPGEVPLTASFTLNGQRIEVTRSGDTDETAGHLLTKLRDAVVSAVPWLAATTEDESGAPPADPSQATSLILEHNDTDPSHALFDIVTSTLHVELALHEAAPFNLLLERWEKLSKLGLDLPTALGFITAEPSRETAGSARRVARNRYSSDASWSNAARELRDGIRRRQRDALYAAARAMPDAPKTDAEFHARYFVDPGMDPCMLTTRLVLAIGSMQTYVNRCLLGLVNDPVTDKPVAFSSDEEEEWRGWRNTYRMWEAARKVFMYPENWLEPSLRVERSPEFDALEQRLMSEALDAHVAEEAFRAYLADILPYGNPLLACMTEDADGNLHFLARAGTSADQLHYRKAERISKGRYRWSAWEKLPFPIPNMEVTRMAMYVQGTSIFIAWAVMLALDVNKEQITEVGLHFVVRSGNQWSDPQQFPAVRFRGLVAGWYPSQFNLYIYEHTSSISDYPMGLYVVLEAGNEKAVFKWSPTLRRALKFDTNGHATPYHDPNDIRIVATSDARWLTSRKRPVRHEAFTIVGVGWTSGLDSNVAVMGSLEPIVVFDAPRKGVRPEVLFPPNFAAWSSTSPFAVVHDTRTYLARLVSHNVGFGDEGGHWRGLRGNWGDNAVSQDADMGPRFELTPLHHTYLPQLLDELDQNGLEGMFGVSEVVDGVQPATFLHQLLQSREAWEELGRENSSLISLEPTISDEDAPVDVIAFSQDAPHRIYNWELFVHAPLRIAERLKEQGEYSAALNWLQLVLDPVLALQPFSSASSSTADVHEAWRPRPLWQPGPFTDASLKNQRWTENPFDVHAIAECDPRVYRYAVARQYVETLTAWADDLFSRDTMESIAEATQIYMIAMAFLGPRPIQVNLRTRRGSGVTFARLRNREPTPDGLRNPLVELENLLAHERSGEPTIRLDTSSIDPSDTVGYFCEPRNDRHMQLWDTLEDRLFKIRHCMNIDGIVRELPIFEPPIDPGALVAAAAAGLALSELRPTRWVSPHIRFSSMMGLARTLVQSVQRLSSALLQAMQSRDGEALAILRQQHEIEVLELADAVRSLQLDQARLNKSAIEATREIVQVRRDHYDTLIKKGMLPAEGAEEAALISAQTAAQKAAGFQLAAAKAATAPRTHLQMGCSGESIGADEVAKVPESKAHNLQMLSNWLSLSAGQSARIGQRTRRKQDWTLQRKLAKAELEQIDAQLATAEQQIEIADRELAQHRRQIAMAREVDRQLRTRFTNQELYAWTVGQLTQLHSQTFQLALEVARKAEVCFRRELGLSASNYIGANHWNASRKGLLAGDLLMADLERLEVAFVEQDRRELEITKHISLKRLDPEALLMLRATGSCTFSVPEVLFDLDFPGHYFRRMKAVTVSIPCLDGGEQQVNATLTLIKSQLRVDPAPSKYSDGENVHERWTERVALSGSRDDSGMFTLDLKDPKYLPFEHRGAISEWNLTLAGAWNDDGSNLPQFDWNEIADMVLHMRYTARYEVNLVSAAKQAVRDWLWGDEEDNEPGAAPMQLGLSFRRDAPDAWNALLQAPDVKTSGATLRLPLSKDRLPYLVAALNPSVAQVQLILLGTVQGATAKAKVWIRDENGAGEVDLMPSEHAGDMPAATISITESVDWKGELLSVQLSSLDSFLDDEQVDSNILLDVVVLLDLAFE